MGSEVIEVSIGDRVEFDEFGNSEMLVFDPGGFQSLKIASQALPGGVPLPRMGLDPRRRRVRHLGFTMFEVRRTLNSFRRAWSPFSILEASRDTFLAWNLPTRLGVLDVGQFLPSRTSSSLSISSPRFAHSRGCDRLHFRFRRVRPGFLLPSDGSRLGVRNSWKDGRGHACE